MATAAKSYKQALTWLLDNDDTEWLNDADAIPSVTANLVADIYGKDDSKVVADLLKLREARRKQG